MFDFFVIYITISLIATALFKLASDKIDRVSLDSGLISEIKDTDFKFILFVFIISLIPIFNIIILGVSLFGAILPKSVVTKALGELKK